MKRNWTEEELVERWTLFPDELALAEAKAPHTRVGFAVLLRFFAGEGRFPRDKGEVPIEVLRFVNEQVDGGPAVGPEGWLRYDFSGRTIKYHRAQIRNFFGFREATVEDGEGGIAGYHNPPQEALRNGSRSVGGRARLSRGRSPPRTGACTALRLLRTARESPGRCRSPP